MTTLRVKEICKQKGITMGQIAERLGITNVNLSYSLNGNPTMKRLQEVADILEVELSDLFVRDDRPSALGFVEIDGMVHKIESIDDLKKLANKFK